MDELPSAEFRRVYAKLDMPTVVKVNGHPIGIWTPVKVNMPGVEVQLDTLDMTATWTESPLPHRPRPLAVASSGERFNTQPFTGPIPKSGNRPK